MLLGFWVLRRMLSLVLCFKFDSGRPKGIPGRRGSTPPGDDVPATRQGATLLTPTAGGVKTLLKLPPTGGVQTLHTFFEGTLK